MAAYFKYNGDQPHVNVSWQDAYESVLVMEPISHNETHG